MKTKFQDHEIADVLSEVSRCLHLHNKYGGADRVGYFEEIQDMVENLKKGKKPVRQN